MTFLLRRLWTWTGLVLGVTLLLGWIRGLRRRDRARRRYADDATDPFRRWMHGAFGIVSGERDYADLSTGQARSILSQWWHVHGPRELESTLDALLDDLDADPAWHGVRYVVVTRLGVAAGWLGREEAWTRARPVAQRLQRRYAGWPELGQAYLVARRIAHGLAEDGSEDDDAMRAILDHVATLREGAWNDVGFHQRLGDPDREQEPDA